MQVAIPKEFHYLIEPAAKFGVRDVLWTHTLDTYIDGLSEDDLKELDELVEQLVVQGQQANLAALLARMEVDFRNQPIYRLFLLFRRLGERKIGSFASLQQFLNLQKVPHVHNWRKLPLGLYYLIPFIEKFGGVDYESELQSRLDEMSVADECELRAVADKLRTTGDGERLVRWGKDYPWVDHPEAQAVWNLIRVMESLGFSWIQVCTRSEASLRRELSHYKWNKASLFLLAKDAAHLLPADGPFLVMDALQKVPAHSLTVEMMSLAYFKSQFVLDWIERQLAVSTLIEDPEMWGALAALSCARWPRIASWLKRGNALGVAGLYTLRAFWDYDSALLAQRRPILDDPPPKDLARQEIQDFLQRQGASEQLDEVSEGILQHWQDICGL